MTGGGSKSNGKSKSKGNGNSKFGDPSTPQRTMGPSVAPVGMTSSWGGVVTGGRARGWVGAWLG